MLADPVGVAVALIASIEPGLDPALAEKAVMRIADGRANRGVAHATSGPCLQQNLVCVLEGEN